MTYISSPEVHLRILQPEFVEAWIIDYRKYKKRVNTNFAIAVACGVCRFRMKRGSKTFSYGGKKTISHSNLIRKVASGKFHDIDVAGVSPECRHRACVFVASLWTQPTDWLSGASVEEVPMNCPAV